MQHCKIDDDGPQHVRRNASREEKEALFGQQQRVARFLQVEALCCVCMYVCVCLCVYV